MHYYNIIGLGSFIPINAEVFSECITMCCGHPHESIQESMSAKTQDVLLNAQRVVAETRVLDDFNDFITTQCESDKTWKLWANFVFEDCYNYVSLFLAIRNSDWNLRMHSLKSMAALFTAYDRQCYQRLIASHVADVQKYPPEVLSSFKAGGFTIKIKGGIGHAVTLDKAHEMCVNRDLKMAIP